MNKTKKYRFSLSLVLALTLLSFAASNLFGQVDRGAGVPPKDLPKDLQGLDIKDRFLPSTMKKVGVLHALTGHVVVTHRLTKASYFGREGDIIYENDSLTTLQRSRCRIRLLDDDVITMAADTQFAVEGYQDQRKQSRKNSLFSMFKGKAMFYAMRLFRYQETRFQLQTPTVTVGVRGTKFGVGVYYVGEEKRADRGIRVADAGKDISPYLAQAGGGQSYTNAFSEDGILNVNGQTVLPGQMYNGQTGQIGPTPPDVIRSFQQATGMGPQGQQQGATQGEGEGDEGGPPLGGTNGQANQGASADLTALTADQTSVQTGAQTEKETASPEIIPYPGPLQGYFATLLRKNPFQDVFLNYQSGYSPGMTSNDDGLTELRQHGIINSSDYFDFSGSPTVHDTACIGGSCANYQEGDPGGVIRYLGQNAYAQWGYWTSNVDSSFTITGGSSPGTYSVVNEQTWFIEAKHITTSTEIAAIATGDYAYGGEAHGTYSNGSTAANMSGTFNSTVHFGSASVKNFDLSVSGGGHSANFSWSGTQSISSNSGGNYFALTAGATAKIDGASVSYKQVSGSLVGSNAQGMIGAWGAACTTSGVGAAGIFSGTR
jgi:hypothetical protein